MNAAFAVLVLWRASKNYNVVLALVLNDFHYVEAGVLRTTRKGFWSWCWTFMVAAFDYRLLGTLWPKIREFVTGHLYFRIRCGFRKTEIVFRAPTGKEFDEMLTLPMIKFQKAFQMSLLDATNRQFILENTGFNTRCAPWELCYAASMAAYRLADDGLFDMKNWELTVWQKDVYNRWTAWETWRHQDPFLSAMALEILKEKLRMEGKDKIVARMEDVISAPLSESVRQELVHSIITLARAEGFDMETSWIEAISEADRIHNQFPQLQ